MRIGGGRIDPASATSSEDRRLGFHVNGLTRFNANGDHTHHGTVLVLHQINGEPLVKKDGLVFDVVLITESGKEENGEKKDEKKKEDERKSTRHKTEKEKPSSSSSSSS